MSNITHKTAKGTVLPILQLRGKDYLEVKYRLVWFREEHPNWSIETDIVTSTDTSAVVRATIRDEQGRIITQSHKFENKQGFPDFIEKAETGSIGRALALLGYGTQWTGDEIEEGARLVDSPVERKPQTKPTQPPEKLANNTRNGNVPKEFNSPEDAGEFVVKFGNKYKGQKLKNIDAHAIDSYIQWCRKDCEKKGTQVSHEVAELSHNFERYIDQYNLASKR